MEKISVIIPTYNRANTILRAVSSVLQQNYENLEVIIVDDGSTDNTEEIIKEIKDNRVLYRKLPENGGVSKARNEGVKMAAGPLLAFQDSDDCWRPDKLKKQKTYLDSHPEYSMIYSFYQCHLENGQTLRVPAEQAEENLEGELFDLLALRNVIGAPTILAKKDSFFACGGFDESLKSLEDWEFVLRFATQYRIGCVQEELVDAYLGSGGVSSRPGAYYESRCKMIAGHKDRLIERGLFDRAVTELFLRAQKDNLLAVVQKMLMLFLGTSR